MWMIGVVWVSVAVMFLIAHATSWAMEEQARSFGPHQFRLNQLLGPERVIDSNPTAAGARGNNVPNLHRWNALLLQASHTALRQQGPGSSPDGKLAAPEQQRIELQRGRVR